MEPKFYPLISDSTFKTMLKKEVFRKWFNDIINKELGIDLSKYEFVDPVLNEGEKTKEYTLDTLLSDKENNYVIIEMQKRNNDKKNITYLFRVAGNMLKPGSDYKEKGNVVLLQFLGYKPTGVTNETFIEYSIRDKTDTFHKEGIEIIDIILKNFYSQKEELDETGRKFALFMCNTYEDMKNISPESKNIIKEMERLYMDENFNLMYNIEVGKELELESAYDHGKQDGISQGISQGIENAQKEIIINMLKNNIKPEEISNITGIKVESINEVLKNME